MQITPAVRVLYERVLRDLAGEGRKARERRLAALAGQIETLEEQLFRADEAFVEERVSPESYARLKTKYEGQLHQARLEHSRLDEGGAGLAEELQFAVRLFSNLGSVYRRVLFHGKHEMLVRSAPADSSLTGKKFEPCGPPL